MAFMDASFIGKLAKQFLMGAGMADPETLGIVDALTAGGFDPPRLENYGGESFAIPAGSTAIMVSTSKPSDDFTVLIVRRRK